MDDGLVESPDSPIMLERYILAVLYYSTDGNIRWYNSTGWLSNQTICSWDLVTCSGDTFELDGNSTDSNLDGFESTSISSNSNQVVGLWLGKSVYIRGMCYAI